MTVLIVWKGGASRITLTNTETIGVIIGVGAAVMLLIIIFFLPWLYRKLIKNDVHLRWFHVFIGPLLLRRPEVQVPADAKVVQDYYRGHKTMEQLQAARGEAHSPVKREDVEDTAGMSGSQENTSGDHRPKLEDNRKVDGAVSPVEETPVNALEHVSIIGPRPAGAIYTPGVMFWQFKRFFFRGIDKDIVNLQGKRNLLTGDLELMHAHAAHYNNKAEYMYSFLQVMTASAASFTHGANDVSK